MNTPPTAPCPAPAAKHRGIALMEAMIALAIVMGAIVAVLWLNSRTVGLAASSRVASAAMVAAQAKMEELRNVNFTSLAAGVYQDAGNPLSYNSGGYGGQATLNVNRCWSVQPIQHAGVNVSDVYQVIVAATDAGSACSTLDEDVPARLVSLIAKNDPRMAAQNSTSSAAADGAGKLVNNVDPSNPGPGITVSGTPNASGLKAMTNESGDTVGILNPDNGQALMAPDGSVLKYATISGNIIFDGVRDRAYINQLQIRTEGNAFCRKFFPGYQASASDLTDPPTISGGGHTLTYIQYSCVVADGWRRSISIITPPPASAEKVCVGYPDMQAENEPEMLESRGRQYVGKGAGGALQGMRGATDDSARIGSLCKEGDPCWVDNPLSARGWVPGGHHYFVTTEVAQLCADRIDTTFSAIDAAGAGQGGGTPSAYYGYLFRNPHQVYCANNKTYTTTLPSIPYSEEFTTDDCYSYTKLSGFITPGETLTINPENFIFGSSSTFYTPCRAMGAFGGFGGGYICGFAESSTISATPLLAGKVFSPTGVAGISPVTVPHDVVDKSFSVLLSGGASSCAASTLNWTVNGNACSAPAASGASGTSTILTSTATNTTGSATFTCAAGAWSGPAAGATCTVGTPPSPSVCPTLTVTGNRANKNATVKLDGTTCTYPSNSSYSCTKNNVAENTSLTVAHTHSSGTVTSKTVTPTVTSGSLTCSFAVNF